MVDSSLDRLSSSDDILPEKTILPIKTTTPITPDIFVDHYAKYFLTCFLESFDRVGGKRVSLRSSNNRQWRRLNTLIERVIVFQMYFRSMQYFFHRSGVDVLINYTINRLRFDRNCISLSSEFASVQSSPNVFDLPRLSSFWNSVCKGILGETQRYSHFNGRSVYLHERSAVPSASQTKHRPK